MINSEDKGITVLSLCDGMSCGQIALEKVGIKVKQYFAAEIKDIAIKVTKYNYPNTIHIGDVNKVHFDNGILHTENGDFYTGKIDIVMFGSPCQSVSIAMPNNKRIGLQDETKSGLFYECHRVLREVNPKYFIMENVASMKNDDRNTISNIMGVEPIRINSSLVSAQNRDRLYWTNVPNVDIPMDKNINLQDVLVAGYTPHSKSRCLMRNDSHGYYNGCQWTPIKRFYRWYYKSFGNMVFPDKESFEHCLKIAKEILGDNKPSAKIFDSYTGNDFDCARYLWKEERARLQNVPEYYCECLTEKEAADVLGDGWTIDIIAHILSNLKK